MDNSYYKRLIAIFIALFLSATSLMDCSNSAKDDVDDFQDNLVIMALISQIKTVQYIGSCNYGSLSLTKFSCIDYYSDFTESDKKFDCQNGTNDTWQTTKCATPTIGSCKSSVVKTTDTGNTFRSVYSYYTGYTLSADPSTTCKDQTIGVSTFTSTWSTGAQEF